MKTRDFGRGMAAGVAITLLLGATPSSPALTQLATTRPVEVILHRFDIQPGQDPAFKEWIDFLHKRHRDAVATLARERTYFEAMFTAPDEPHRLYWITVQGAGGAQVESSDLDLDRKHVAYMDAVLVKGSHRRLITQNVLAPDFIVQAIDQEQNREKP